MGGRFALVSLLLVVGGCGPKEPAMEKAGVAASLKVTSTAFESSQAIPRQFGGSETAEPITITWEVPPASAKSVAVLVEDPDAPGLGPFVHWLVTNIPTSSTKLPGAGDVQPNSAGKRGYYPPNPPGGGPHHYHFQVFALDLPTVAAKDRDALLKEIKGHVVASGELVGTYQAK